VANYLYRYRFAPNSQKAVTSVTPPGNGLIVALDLGA
jgi:hypothetical protein